MKTIQLMIEENNISLRKALSYSGLSSCMYYYRKRERKQAPALDSAIIEAVRRVALERPSFGTRRMAAILTRELGTPSEQEEGTEDIPRSELGVSRDEEERDYPFQREITQT